jgi:hypothetical protein
VERPTFRGGPQMANGRGEAICNVPAIEVRIRLKKARSDSSQERRWGSGGGNTRSYERISLDCAIQDPHRECPQGHAGKGSSQSPCPAGTAQPPGHCQPKPRVDERPSDAFAVLLAHSLAASHGVPARPHVLFEVVYDPGGFLPRQEEVGALRESVGRVRVAPVIADRKREVSMLFTHQREGRQVIGRGQPPLMLRGDHCMVADRRRCWW